MNSLPTAIWGLQAGRAFTRPLSPRWRGGRVAEGAPLLRAYTLTRIEGSNPFLSATQTTLSLRKIHLSIYARQFRDLAGLNLGLCREIPIKSSPIPAKWRKVSGSLRGGRVSLITGKFRNLDLNYPCRRGASEGIILYLLVFLVNSRNSKQGIQTP